MNKDENVEEKQPKTPVSIRMEKETELSQAETACAKDFERKLSRLLAEFDYEFYPLTVKTDKGEQTSIKYRRVGRHGG